MNYPKFKRAISSNKFPDIDSDIKQLLRLENILTTRYEIESKFSVSDFIKGGLFDHELFNKEVNKVNELRRKIRNVKEKIRLLKLKYETPDYDMMTIGEFKSAIIIDIYDMVNEILHMKTIYELPKIINKNYRKITILLFVFVVLIVVYLIIYKFYVWINK